MSDIPTKYYHKELVSMPLFLSRGVKAPFEPIGNDEGLLATADSSLIFSLSNAISRRIGGVSEISLESYEEFKKKETPTRPLSSRLQPVRASPTPTQAMSKALQLPKEKAVAVAAESKPPAQAPPVPAPPGPVPGSSKRQAKTGKAPDVSSVPPPIQ